MTNDINIELVGDKELHQVFTGLDYKLQHKQLKKVVGNVAQSVVGPLKKEIPKRQTNLRDTGSNFKYHSPGLGKKSISKKVGKSKRNAVYFVGPKGPKGDYRKDPFYLRWWEFGAYGKNTNLRITKFFERNLKNMEDKMAKAIRVIMEREMNKARKTGII